MAILFIFQAAFVLHTFRYASWNFSQYPVHFKLGNKEFKIAVRVIALDISTILNMYVLWSTFPIYQKMRDLLFSVPT